MTPHSRTSHLMTCLVAVCLVSGCRNTGTGSNPALEREGVLIHLSKGPESPHAVAMALKMAEIMAADRDVLVYCDLEGINTILKDSPDITFPTFNSSRSQLGLLLGKAVPVYACPSCLKALGKTPDDLMPGVRTAEKEAFFTFTKGRILTLDY